MKEDRKLQYLKLAPWVIGAVFVGGIFLLMQVWPAGWLWTPRQPEREQMILVHGGIMLVQALADPTERADLLGDVPALILVALVLLALLPRPAWK